MNSNITYKVLIILFKRGKNYHFLYGHALYWETNELIADQNKWVKYDADKKIRVFLCNQDKIQFNNLKHAINENNEYSIFGGNTNYKFKFNLPFFLNDFFVESNDKKYFNPFISYSSKLDAYFSEDFEIDDLDYDDFLKQNLSALQKIKETNNIDFLRYPYLYQSFNCYHPFRLRERFKGFQDSSHSGFTICFWDELQKYNNPDVIVKTFDNYKEKCIKVKFSEQPIFYDIGFVPDRVITEIYDTNGEKIYKNDSHVVKSINLKSNVVEKEVIINNKSILQYWSNEKRIVSGDDKDNWLNHFNKFKDRKIASLSLIPMLHENDPIKAQDKVIKIIANNLGLSDELFIMDPYFDAQALNKMLPILLKRTNMKISILTRMKKGCSNEDLEESKERLINLKNDFNSRFGITNCNIKKADRNFHDRFIWGINNWRITLCEVGISFNEIGTSYSSIVEIADAVFIREVQKLFDILWEKGTEL